MSGESATILDVQNDALFALGALVEKIAGKSKIGELKRATKGIEREIATQLAILARCFELQDEFKIIELDYVRATAPANLEGHRLGVAEAREDRREAVLERTTRLTEQMGAAGLVANANIILHSHAAHSVIQSQEATAAIVDDFHAPLGIASSREELSATSWREALHDTQQLKKAEAEIGQRTAKMNSLATTIVLATVGTKNLHQGKV